MSNDFFKKAYNKNYYRLYKLFFIHGKLVIPPIIRLREEFAIKGKLEAVDPAKDPNRYEELLNFSENAIASFIKKYKDNLPYIFQELSKIRKSTGLGHEWNTTLFRFMVSGICLPPPYSLFFYEDGDAIIIEINESTTKKDLDFAWENELKDLRQEKYKKTRATFPKKQTWDNLDEQIKSMRIKKLKNKDSVEDVCFDKKDMDIVGEIYENVDDISEQSDQKRINRLRVNRHRIKKITR